MSRNPNLGNITPLLRATNRGITVDSSFSLEDDEALLSIEESEQETENSALHENEKESHPKLAYFLVIILGVGTLLPWNMFLIAYSYYSIRFEGSPFEMNFENFFILSFQVFNVAFLFYLVRNQHRFSYHSKIEKPFWLQLFIFFIFTCMIPYKTSAFFFFFFTLFCCALAGIATAFIQGSVFAFVGLLSAKYIPSACIGQGLGAILISFCSISSMIAGKSASESAFFYFSTCVLVQLICIWSYRKLISLDSIRLQIQQQSLYPDNGFPSADSDSETLYREITLSQDHLSTVNVLPQESASSAGSTFRRIWYLPLSLGSTYVATFLIFPGVASLVKPVVSSPHSGDYVNRIYSDLWIPFFVFFLWSVGDFCGKTLSMFYHFPKSEKALVFFLFGRWIFVPLFLLCNRKDYLHVSLSPFSSTFFSLFDAN
eukprot:Sdes_comp20622_c0_seq1m15753